MYPPVTQFETRRHEWAAEMRLQLERDSLRDPCGQQRRPTPRLFRRLRVALVGTA
jgi:hypothetical protein